MNIGVDDAVWRAMGDGVRREMVEVMEGGAVTTGALVERFSGRLGRTGVMKHLDVLEGAGLVRVEREGRRRWNVLERAPLERACAWLEKRIAGHRGDLWRLKELAEKDQPNQPNQPNQTTKKKT